jgi:hypothetical protein
MRNKDLLTLEVGSATLFVDRVQQIVLFEHISAETRMALRRSLKNSHNTYWPQGVTKPLRAFIVVEENIILCT